MANTVQATLSQGNTDFSPYVAPGGVVQSFAERVATSIVTLDGKLRKTYIKKRQLSVTLHDMTHEDLVTLFSGITALANWSYLDADAGAQTKQFYLTGPTVTQNIARNGLTYCSGISFSLEEA